MKTALYIFVSLVLLLLIYIPYVVSAELMSGVNQAKVFWFYGVSLLVICVTSGYLAFKNKPVIPFHWADLFLLLYYVYIAGHIFFTDQELYYSDKFTTLTLWSAVYVILKTFWYPVNRESERYMEIFTLGILVSAGGQAVIGLLQLYGFEPSLNNQFQITGTFINPAPYSFFLGAVFPFALAVYFKYKEELKNSDNHKNVQLPFIGKVRITVEHVLYYTSMIALLLILLILPVTLIRTGWLMAIAGSMVVLYAHYRVEIHRLWAKKWVKAIGIPAVLIVALGASTGTYLLKKDSADGRALIWEITLDKIKEAPIFGQGYGAFYSQYNNWQAEWFAGRPQEKEGPKAMLAGNVKFAYNEFMEVAAELGIAGLFLLLLFVGGILKSRGSPNREKRAGYRIAVLSGMIALLAGSLFSYPLYSLPTVILLLLYITIAVGYQKPWKIIKVNLAVRLSALVVVIAFSFLFIKSKAAAYQAFKDWKYANYFLTTNNTEIAIETYEELYPALKREGMFLQQYGKTLSLNGDHQKSIEILSQATAYGSDIYLYATLGDNYKALGRKEEAVAAYQKAIDMAPHKFYAPYLLAMLHFDTGDTARAQQIAKKLLDKPVKVHSTAIDEIKQEMKNILTAGNPENKGPETERAKPSAIRKDAGGKDDV